MRALLKTALAVATGSVLAASAARADTITAANVPTTTSNFGYLAPGQSYNLAVDLTGGSTTNTGETINGVTFAPGGLTGTSVGATSAALNGVSYSLTGSSSGSNESGFTGFGSGASDTNVAKLLADFYYNAGSAPAAETLTLTGLTPGATVTLTELNSAFGQGSTSGREESEVGTAGSTVTNYSNGTANSYEENNGAFSTLTYVAVVPANGTVSITSSALDANHDSQHYYGFTVSQTPEPAAAGLLGVASLLLLGRRRRV